MVFNIRYTISLFLIFGTISVYSQTRKISIDYSKQRESSSGLIFGACGFEASGEYKNYGITFMRSFCTPSRIIKDLKIVNTKDKNIATIVNAKKNGYITMVAIGGIPEQLSVTGTNAGMPKDWNTFEDVIKRIVTTYGSSIDYIEVWNEPDWQPKMLDPAKSGLTHFQLYVEYYKHMHKAIREVNKTVKIGGPTLLAPPIPNAKNPSNKRAFEWLMGVLTDPFIKENIDFISYHNYQPDAYPEQFEPMAQNVIALCKAHLGKKIPVFNTEWNNHYDSGPAWTTDLRAFEFHGKQFINFIHSGLTGSAFYTTTGIVSNDTRVFYTGNQPAYPRVWKMAAISLDLNKGEIPVMETHLTSEAAVRGYEIWGVGCLNSAKEPCALVLGQGKPVDIELKNLNLDGDVTIEVYLASPDNDGTKIWKTFTKKAGETSTVISLAPPTSSVIGLRIRKSISSTLHVPKYIELHKANKLERVDLLNQNKYQNLNYLGRRVNLKYGLQSLVFPAFME